MIEVIKALEVDYLYVGPSQISNAGQGLYTTIEIHKGEVISIFKGEILSPQEAKDKERRLEHQYFICLLDGSIMGSKHVDCFAK
jgi:uncharacterized protein